MSPFAFIRPLTDELYAVYVRPRTVTGSTADTVWSKRNSAFVVNPLGSAARICVSYDQVSPRDHDGTSYGRVAVGRSRGGSTAPPRGVARRTRRTATKVAGITRGLRIAVEMPGLRL